MATMDGNDPNAGGDWWSQNAPQVAATTGAPTGDYQRIAVAPDGVPIYQNGSRYFTRSPDGSIQEQFQGGLPDWLKQQLGQMPKPNPEPIGGGGGGTITGDTGAVPFGVPTSGFGAAPQPYISNAAAPVYQPMPTYTPPTWTGGDFVNPTAADLYASPGYQTRLNTGLQGRERSAAAQGTILNGGTQKALERYGQDYANNEYQTLRNNSLDAYKQKYAQFTDAAGMSLAARTANANENQNTFQNNTNSYLQGNSRTLSDYLTNLTAKRNSETDYWGRLQDLNQTGANLAGGSYRA
jgi:hypothetical protein